jgi:MFS family permease
MFGQGLGYIIFALGGSLWVLFLGRIIGGITGGNLSTAAAYIADARSDPLQGTRMVNWNVVGERVSELTVDLRKLWADFTRQITGPP